MSRDWRWLTVAASAACAPLNPAYGADELDRYFADLHPRALITQAGFNSSARCGGHHVALDLAIAAMPAHDPEGDLIYAARCNAAVASEATHSTSSAYSFPVAA